MLDGLLGRGFSSKCKSLIKPTRTRIDVLRRRAEAKQRFLKEDLAKLLANGLDINAYGRTEEFLAGLSLLSCYDFIEQSCEYVVKELSIMQKQRECPEECREAVSSLMFAAARFSDLPELRDLRDVFQERYGNSLEYFVNQKFVEKLASKPPLMEKRLQLLQDIALEFSIKWDSRGFEQRMANPSAFMQDQPKQYGRSHVTDDKYKLPNGKDTVPKTDKRDVSSKERFELFNDGHRMHNGREGNILKRGEVDFQFGRQESTGNGHKPLTSGGETISKGENNDISSRRRREFTADKHVSLKGKADSALKTVRSGSSSRGKRLECIDDGYTMHNDGVNIILKGESQDPSSHGKSEVAPNSKPLPVKSDGKDVSSGGNDHGSQQNIYPTRKVQDEESDKSKFYYSSALPPPYVKSKDNVVPPPYIKKEGSKCGATMGSKHAHSDCDGHSMDPSSRNRANAVHSSDRIQKEPDHLDQEEQGFGPARVNSRGREKDHRYQDDIPLPKPRSIRRKHSKSSSNHDDLGNFEDAGVVKRSSSSRRKEHSRKGLQILFDDEHYKKDEEERMMDKLLLHYSKKPSTYEVGKLRKKSQAHPSHHIAADAGETSHNRSKDGPDVKSEMVPPPTRSVSLPHEQIAPSEAKKVFARANSFQQDNQARHVHPKLPDYDDLAARFAALRGR